MQRLKSRQQFQAVLAGNVVAKTEHFALHCNDLHAQAPQTSQKNRVGGDVDVRVLFPIQSMWIGAMVPKRWARRAVTRNAIKRQIYTVSADLSHHFPPAAFVVRLRKEFSRKEFISATSGYLVEVVRAEVVALMNAGSASKARPL